MSANQQLAAIFQQMADIMEILGEDRFRVIAYAKAVRSIEALSENLESIGPDAKKLATLPGIGKGLAEKIAEFLNCGSIEAHQDLMSRIPPKLPELLDVPGLGPKTIALMWKDAGVESLADLKKKLEGEELAKLPGLGAKKLENLRKSIAFSEKAVGRIRIGQAMPLALWFVEQLRAMPGVKQAEYAGSLRRGKETIGDLDLLVAADKQHAAAISDAFVKLEPVSDVLAKGATKTSIRTDDGVQADLRIVEPASFGAALMYFTGSKEHNVRLRERAIKFGYSLNEYALTQDEKPIASTTEQDIYKALKLVWIPPELREDHGEIARAESAKEPIVLLERSDIKAELHAHTNASDGHWTIRELAEAAAARGFHTLAVTDHSKGQAQANGLDERRLEQHIENIRAVAAEMKDEIAILAGSEVDILADGSLDYADSLLKELDVVVASPHAALSQEPAKATQRLLKAIDNPYVTILGHATGRLINRREGLNPDMSELIKAAARRGIAMEINANHYRLDLRDHHARAAIEAGVKLAINTDAHGPADLNELRYGVLTARRAGATKDDVVNCMDQKALRKWIQSTRSGAV